MGRRPKDAPKLEDLLPIVVAEYQSGMSLREIAAPPDRKISTATVNDLLIRAGVPKRSTGEGTRLRDQQRGRSVRRDIPEEELRRLYLDELWSVIRISKHFGVSADVIDDRLKRYNIVRTPEQERAAKQIIDDLRKATNTELFGGASANYDPDVRARTAATNLERHGAENPFGSKVIQGKIKATHLAQRGVENPAQDPAVLERRRVTNRDRHGADYYMQTEEFRNRVQALYLDPVYRATHQDAWAEVGKRGGATKNAPGWREAHRQRIYENGHSQQSHLPQWVWGVLKDKASLQSFIRENGFTIVNQISEALGCSYSLIIKRTHDYGIYDDLDHYSSRYEVEIGEMLAGWGITTTKTNSVIAPYQIDRYAPEHKAGVEYNGDFWHSEAAKEYTGRPNNYHQKKALMAEAKGVKLYQIFGYEWADPRTRPIIISQLRHMFHLSERKIGARGCDIVEVSPSEATAFLDKNHLQGRVGSRVRLGLRYDGELVALMTFGPPRFSKKFQWEIYRYATLTGANVQGGATRLFKRFVRQHAPDSVMSFSALATGNGGMYRELKFIDEGPSSSLDYVWADFVDTPRPRSQSTGKKLRQEFSDVIPNIEAMNERSIMEHLGYSRIFGCGNRFWSWHA